MGKFALLMEAMTMMRQQYNEEEAKQKPNPVLLGNLISRTGITNAQMLSYGSRRNDVVYVVEFLTKNKPIKKGFIYLVNIEENPTSETLDFFNVVKWKLGVNFIELDKILHVEELTLGMPLSLKAI